MKILRLLLLVIITGLTISLTACHKKLDNNVLISSTGNSSGGSINGDLLIRTSIRYNSDSTVFTYTYNNAKQLVATQYRPSSAGTFFNNDFERDAAGLIVRRKEYITTLLNPTPANVSITIYHYSNNTTPQITYSIKNSEGIFTVDSIVYTYNNVGKLIETNLYQLYNLPGIVPSQRKVFTYDTAKNVIKLEEYHTQNGTSVLGDTYVFTYDNKISPQNYTEAEAIAIYGQPVGQHNGTGYQIISSAMVSGSNNYTYVYNSSGRPASCQLISTRTFSTTPTIYDYTFYYR